MISWMMKIWVRSDPSKKDFSPPTLIEKFQQPIIKSEPFTGFEVDTNSFFQPHISFSHSEVSTSHDQLIFTFEVDSIMSIVHISDVPMQPITYSTLPTSIAISTNHCQPIPTTVNHCQPISTTVNQYQPPSQPKSTTITTNINHHHNQYQPLSNNINHCQTISTTITTNITHYHNHHHNY